MDKIEQLLEVLYADNFSDEELEHLGCSIRAAYENHFGEHYLDAMQVIASHASPLLIEIAEVALAKETNTYAIDMIRNRRDDVQDMLNHCDVDD